jgi:hypothetical protein
MNKFNNNCLTFLVGELDCYLPQRPAHQDFEKRQDKKIALGEIKKF